MNVKDKIQELISILKEEEAQKDSEPEVVPAPAPVEAKPNMLSKDDSEAFIRIREEIMQTRYDLGALVVNFEAKREKLLEKSRELDSALELEFAHIKELLEYDEEQAIAVSVDPQDPDRVIVREK